MPSSAVDQNKRKTNKRDIYWSCPHVKRRKWIKPLKARMSCHVSPSSRGSISHLMCWRAKWRYSGHTWTRPKLQNGWTEWPVRVTGQLPKVSSSLEYCTIQTTWRHWASQHWLCWESSSDYGKNEEDFDSELHIFSGICRGIMPSVFWDSICVGCIILVEMAILKLS